MAGTWQTVNGLLDAIAAEITDMPDRTKLPPKWTNVATVSLTRARGLITRALRSKGYTADQVNGWDDLLEFSTDQGLYESLYRGASLGLFVPDKDIIKMHDRREELKDPTVLVDGEVIVPDATQGQVYVEEFSDDCAQFPNPNEIVW